MHHKFLTHSNDWESPCNGHTHSLTPPATLFSIRLMTALKHCIYALSLIILLSGCGQQPRTVSTIQSTSPIPDHWVINAKLGIRSTRHNGSVTLHWQQQQQQYHIRISGPLGQGSGVLSGDRHFITLQRTNKNTLHSANPEKLIEKSFGWLLPLQHLNYWIRGLPSPGLNITTLNESTAGTITSLQQSGWSLTYTGYHLVDHWLVPGRIRAQKGDTILTLIIKKWAFPTQTAP